MLLTQFYMDRLVEKKYNYEPDAILLLEPITLEKIERDKKAIIFFKRNKIILVRQLKFHPFQTLEIKGHKWKFLRKSNKINIKDKCTLKIIITLMVLYLFKTKFLKNIRLSLKRIY